MARTALPEIRVAVLGAGLIGQLHSHAYRRLGDLRHSLPANVRLAVVADVHESLAEEVADRFGFERTATSWEEVADAKDVDAVTVALPNHEHRPAVEALLASGKHVLCEKPLANTAADSWALLQAARRAGVVHGVGFNLRRMPAIAGIKAALDRGDLGEPRQFIGNYLVDYAADPELPLNWRFRHDLAGGGALTDVGPHIVDASRYLFGDIESVQGSTMATFISERPIPAGHTTGHERGSVTGEFGVVDTDDLAVFSARFRNGAVGTFSVSRVAPGHVFAPEFSVIGSAGSARFDARDMAEFEFFRATGNDGATGGSTRVKVTGAHPYYEDVQVYPFPSFGHGMTESWVGQAYEFVGAVARGVPMAGGSFEDGYAADLVLEAVRLSAERNAEVLIDEISSNDDGLR